MSHQHLLVAGMLLLSSISGLRSGAITIDLNEAIPEFPDRIVFVLAASSGSEIKSVELEFGTDQLLCGEAMTRAIPQDFSPGTTIEAEWTWNLRRSGALPPGTRVWWRWKLQDESGEVEETPEKSLIFTDHSIGWQHAESAGLDLYWHEGSTEFAQALIDTGERSLGRLQQDAGVDIDVRIQVYIYGSSEEMQSATLFAPAWSGGLAFPDHRTVLIGIPPASLDWGKRALAHELSHVVIGRYTFSCVDSTPIWANEGLAMYAEGNMRPYHADLLSSAIENRTLQSIRALGEIFSGDPDRASLAYAQSFSLVEFLIQTYGRRQILRLLDEFRQGASEDRALMKVYGVDRDGLEAAWRNWVGAAPLSVSEESAWVATHTPYPTLAPIVGVSRVETDTPEESIPATSPPSPLPRATELLPEGLADDNDARGLPAWGIGAGLLLTSFVIVGGLLLRRRRTAIPRE